VPQVTGSLTAAGAAQGVQLRRADAQRALLALLAAPGAVLVGHALHHDLRALRVDFQPVIDTSLLFTYRRAAAAQSRGAGDSLPGHARQAALRRRAGSATRRRCGAITSPVVRRALCMPGSLYGVQVWWRRAAARASGQRRAERSSAPSGPTARLLSAAAAGAGAWRTARRRSPT